MLSLIILTVAAVSASDADNTTIQENGGILHTDSVIEQGLKVNNVMNDSIGSFVDLEDADGNVSVGSFEELANLINSNSVINLTKDYAASESDTGICINADITINGNGHTIIGNNKREIFTIEKGNVFLNDIVFKNGSTSYGGAICGSNAGSVLTLNNATFLKNVAGVYGGAIYSRGNINIYNSTFIDNFANHCGGAISTEGCLKINNTLFKSNIADYDYGGAISTFGSLNVFNSKFIGNLADELGGAIYSYDSLIIKKCKFISNKADDDYGGAILTHGKICSVSDSEFMNNSANVDGGAIWSDESVSVKNSIFKYNQASGASVFQSCGGAIKSSEDVKVDNCTFSNNHAKDYGGAIYSKTITWVDSPSFFIENYAEDNTGGAIYTNRFTTDVSNAVFIGNGVKGHDDGGAIYINNKNYITFTHCTFKGNYAGDEGGAIYLDSKYSHLSLRGNVLIDNTAGDKGHIVYNCGYYDEIRNNWYGTDKPDLTNKFKECHWNGDEDHFDSGPALTNPTLNENPNLE